MRLVLQNSYSWIKILLNTCRDIINEIPKLARQFQIFCPLNIWVFLSAELRLSPSLERSCAPSLCVQEGLNLTTETCEGSTSCREENGTEWHGNMKPLNEEGRCTLCVCWKLPLKLENRSASIRNHPVGKKKIFAHFCQYSSSEKLNWVDQCYMSTLSLKQSSLDTLVSCSFANKSGLRGRCVVHNCISTQLLQTFFSFFIIFSSLACIIDQNEFSKRAKKEQQGC